MSKVGSIHVCRTRLTRLNAAGVPIVGASTTYVTDSPITIGISPEVTEGERREVINGCDCVTLTYRSPDRLSGFTFDLENGHLEPEAIELMTRAPVIPGASAGSVIGNVFPDDTGSCIGTPSGIAVEFWSEARVGGQPGALPYIHWLFPRTVWQFADNELSVEFLTPSFSGYSEPNAQFGDPYDDQPTGMPTVTQGAWWLTATAPPAVTPTYAALAAAA